MRKGPLGRTTIDELLREAAGKSLTGGLRIDAVPGGTIFLRNGYVCDVEVDGATVPLDLASTSNPSKELVRRHFEVALSGLLDATHGWYHFDQYLHPPDSTPWVFHTTAMLDGVAERRAGVEPVRPWGGQPLRLTRSPYRRFEVTADMWDIVVALSSRLTGYQIAELVDWEPNRLASVLRQMTKAELLAAPEDIDADPDADERDADVEPEPVVSAALDAPTPTAPVLAGTHASTVTASIARPYAPTAPGTPHAPTAPPPPQPTATPAAVRVARVTSTDARPLPLEGSTVPWTPRGATDPSDPATARAERALAADPRTHAETAAPAGARPTGRRSALKRLIGSLRA